MKWYSDSVEGEFEYYRARVMSDDTLLPPQLVAFIQDRCIFTAADPCSTYKKTILGFGSAALRGGDKLVNVCGGLKESLGRNEFYNSRPDQVYEAYALILRPVEAGSTRRVRATLLRLLVMRLSAQVIGLMLGEWRYGSRRGS